jgi:TonB family protein
MRRSVLLVALLAACTGEPKPDPEGDVVPPVPVAGQPELPFPPELYAQRIEGEVLLYLVVDSTGAVLRDSTKIAKSSGRVEFDAAAMKAAPTLQFTPATRNGVAVMHAIQVPIRFTIPDTLAPTGDSAP